jgi:hypothetical protein
MAQGAESLSSKHEVLSSNSRIVEKKKKAIKAGMNS